MFKYELKKNYSEFEYITENGFKLSNSVLIKRLESLQDVLSKLSTAQEKIKELKARETRLSNLIIDIDNTLFQHNHHIVGYHLNGDHEPIMNIVAEFDMEAIRAKPDPSLIPSVSEQKKMNESINKNK